MERNWFSIGIKTQNLEMINFTYLIIDKISKEAVIVDPAWEIDKIIKEIDKYNLKITKVVLTHSHNDHVNLVEEFINRYNAEVFISKDEAEFYKYKVKNLNLVSDGDYIMVGNVAIKCILTPGHTCGSLCFYVEDELFTGDTLFIEGCGRCDLEGGSAHSMFHSIQKIKRIFSNKTKVYPGHSYGFGNGLTLLELSKINIYYNINKLEDFVNFRMRKNQSEVHEFK